MELVLLSSQNLLPARTEPSAYLRSGGALTADLRAGRALWFYPEPWRRKLKPASCTPEGWGCLVFPPGGLVDLLTEWNCSLKAQPCICVPFCFPSPNGTRQAEVTLYQEQSVKIIQLDMHEKVHQATLRVSCMLAHHLLSVVRGGLPLHSCEDGAFCNHELQRDGFWEGFMDWGGLSSCSWEEPLLLPRQSFFRTSKETLCDILGPTFNKYREEIMANPQPWHLFFFF